jgi:hypothetical protein
MIFVVALMQTLTAPFRPIITRLAPVDEDNSAKISPVDVDSLSPVSSRPRLESTASSRYFPGSWFSASSTKSPRQEGRASLEIARGIITPIKSPVDASVSPIQLSVPPTTPVTGVVENEKSKWGCLVM